MLRHFGRSGGGLPTGFSENPLKKTVATIVQYWCYSKFTSFLKNYTYLYDSSCSLRRKCILFNAEFSAWTWNWHTSNSASPKWFWKHPPTETVPAAPHLADPDGLADSALLGEICRKGRGFRCQESRGIARNSNRERKWPVWGWTGDTAARLSDVCLSGSTIPTIFQATDRQTAGRTFCH